MSYERIKWLTKERNVLITDHAWEAMEKRGIKIAGILTAILNGEVIEEYPEDKPCPSFLILGFVDSKPIHVVVALCQEHVRIITTYEPDPIRWEDFRIRKKGGK